MKPILIWLVAIAASAGLSGCRPDQEYRLVEACRQSVTYIVAPEDDGMGKTCSCLAKAAVDQLDYDTIEAMIGMFEGDQVLLASNSAEGMETMQKIMNFQLNNAACMT